MQCNAFAQFNYLVNKIKISNQIFYFCLLLITYLFELFLLELLRVFINLGLSIFHKYALLRAN